MTFEKILGGFLPSVSSKHSSLSFSQSSFFSPPAKMRAKDMDMPSERSPPICDLLSVPSYSMRNSSKSLVSTKSSSFSASLSPSNRTSSAPSAPRATASFFPLLLPDGIWVEDLHLVPGMRFIGFPLINASMFFSVVSRISPSASLVLKALCGVIMTFDISIRT